jgi:CRP/FNR family cyclic AMP-dependent transcriptional regulator
MKILDETLIRSSCLGDELTEEECRVLAGVMDVVQLSDGEMLVSEGQDDDTLFLLVGSKLAVSNFVAGRDVRVYTMTSGECAGTRAFVDRTPRKATLRAVGDATVYTLEPDVFETLYGTHPRIVYKVMRALFRTTHTNLTRMNQQSQELINYVSKVGGRY